MVDAAGTLSAVRINAYLSIETCVPVPVPVRFGPQSGFFRVQGRVVCDLCTGGAEVEL